MFFLDYVVCVCVCVCVYIYIYISHTHTHTHPDQKYKTTLKKKKIVSNFLIMKIIYMKDKP